MQVGAENRLKRDRIIGRLGLGASYADVGLPQFPSEWVFHSLPQAQVWCGRRLTLSVTLSHVNSYLNPSTIFGSLLALYIVIVVPDPLLVLLFAIKSYKPFFPLSTTLSFTKTSLLYASSFNSVLEPLFRPEKALSEKLKRNQPFQKPYHRVCITWLFLASSPGWSNPRTIG